MTCEKSVLLEEIAETCENSGDFEGLGRRVAPKLVMGL